MTDATSLERVTEADIAAWTTAAEIMRDKPDAFSAYAAAGFAREFLRIVAALRATPASSVTKEQCAEVCRQMAEHARVSFPGTEDQRIHAYAWLHDAKLAILRLPATPTAALGTGDEP